MMNGPVVISPPPLSTVQELKDLLHLAADHKKSSEFLHSLEQKLKETHEANIAHQALVMAAEQAKVALDAKKAELEKREISVAAREKSVSAADASFYQREVLVLAGEKALVEKKKSVDAESEALLLDLKSKQKALEKSHASALEMKVQAEQLIRQYNEKSARIKAAVGG